MLDCLKFYSKSFHLLCYGKCALKGTGTNLTLNLQQLKYPVSKTSNRTGNIYHGDVLNISYAIEKALVS